MPDGISKTSTVRVTVGFLLVGAVFVAGGIVEWRKIYEEITVLQSTTTTLRNDIDGMRGRQGKYVGQDGSYTKKDEEHDALLSRICEHIAALHGEPFCR